VRQAVIKNLLRQVSASSIDAEVGNIALNIAPLSIIDVLILGSAAEYRLNIGSVSLSIG
jgi:hypothetical protein